ncbi:MAG: M14 family zinc carboxypeptidase [Ilumatobacter sp.]|uniref:M14 family metallopeptidase n=1 Tax=Ilumatobacter sp. TaxID=1967498 RepID=UPI003C7407CD
MRRMHGLFMSATLLASVLAVGSASADDGTGLPAASGGDRLELYTGDVTLEEFSELRAEGYDIVDTSPGGTPGTVEIEAVVSATELVEIESGGIEMDPVLDQLGRTSTRSAQIEADNGFEVWRSYSEPGGIRDEMISLADEYPDLLKLKSIGTTVNGQDILALKLTHDANRVSDGRRPAVLYSAAQHAREWITVETTRRLLRYYLDNYGTDREITDLVNRNELWFVLVANPDGYDWTFEEGQRLWRKNLADNNGDGDITTADGVDLNRNWPTKWGYDNEGSSPDIGNQTYRGTGPSSEPETQALDGLLADIGFAFQVNYHSAAELLLYGIGWQVSTPSPDDIVYEALAGDDEDPAVEGYDPDISAELYTTNGETTEHAHTEYGTLAYTPELDTCDSAETIFDDDEFGDTYCEDDGRSVFEFPDDEELVQAVFEKNIDFAVSVAASAADPANPKSSLDREAPDFVVDEFDVSYGGTQTVAVETTRSSFFKRMYYKVGDERTRSTRVSRWQGGERYGGDLDFLYGEYRGDVKGAEVGDEVTVWFSAWEIEKVRYGHWYFPRFRRMTSEPFTYEVASDSGAHVLIVANEDYLGFGPEQPGVTGPVALGAHAAALEANGIDYDVWDITAQGVPHPLGTLDHYDAVVWELGDNRLTQEAGDVITESFIGDLEDTSVAEAQQFTTLAIRDYLNEGGKVFQTGEYTGYFGTFGGQLGGVFYGLNGDATADCVVTQSFFEDCLLLSDDFSQYYQGMWRRSTSPEPSKVVGIVPPVAGATADIDGAATPNSGAFAVTSDVLPPDEFPQFSSEKIAEYVSDGPVPFTPFSGEQYAAAGHADNAWMRLATTVDLGDASAASLAFKLWYDTEGGYDHAVVEARIAGTEEWTTLPDANGATSTDPPAECEGGFFIDLHPDLANYLTLGDPCDASGATGVWNSFTGDSGGWTDAEVDLTDFAGQQVEVAISYISDPNTGGVGVFVDDTVITVDGVVVDENDFEDGPGAWTVPGAPESSPGNSVDWVIGPALFEPPAAAVSTEDTVTLGFGFEAIATAEERAGVMGAVMDFLLGGSTGP